MLEIELRPTKLGLVLPCDLYRDLIYTALSVQPDIEIVFTSSGIHDLQGRVDRRDAEIIVLHISYFVDCVSTITVIEQLRLLFPVSRFVMLSNGYEPLSISALKRWGISGYLLLDYIRLSDIMECIRAVRVGDMVVCPTTKEIRRRSKKGARLLTEVEMQVVNALASDVNYSSLTAEIQLEMSGKIIREHLQSVAEKLGTFANPRSVIKQCRFLKLIDVAPIPHRGLNRLYDKLGAQGIGVDVMPRHIPS